MSMRGTLGLLAAISSLTSQGSGSHPHLSKPWAMSAKVEPLRDICSLPLKHSQACR